MAFRPAWKPATPWSMAARSPPRPILARPRWARWRSRDSCARCATRISPTGCCPPRCGRITLGASPARNARTRAARVPSDVERQPTAALVALQIVALVAPQQQPAVVAQLAQHGMAREDAFDRGGGRIDHDGQAYGLVIPVLAIMQGLLRQAD